MQHILVYGDSLTWGIVPNTRKRFPFDERWPGILENKLIELGHRVRLIRKLSEWQAYGLGRSV